MKLLTKTTTLAAVIAGTMLTMAAANAGIADTKHNLGSSSTAGNNQTTATGEICVFCHTPHASNTAIVAPLWNKPASGATYSQYSTGNSSSLDGEVVPVGSVSIACLSCHDGTQAMDMVINAPGSGGFNADGDTMGLGSEWTGANQTNGLMTGLAALGTDLKNDHPIGIQYAGGGYGVGQPGVGLDVDFAVPQTAQINGSNVWWVDTPVFDGVGGNATLRDKTDMQLYTRTDGTGSYEQPFVECASCHDPHVADSGTRETFLRISNDGSKVCLACHTK
jgi:predicted CXXCH cytochrome family protein